MLLFEHTYSVLSTDIEDSDINFSNEGNFETDPSDILYSLVQAFVEMNGLNELDLFDPQTLSKTDVTVDGDSHTLYILYFVDPKNSNNDYNTHVIGFDHNYTKNQYTIGYVQGSTYNNTVYYLKVTEPIIRLIEKSSVPVYIGAFSFDGNGLYKSGLHDIDAKICLNEKDPKIYMPETGTMFFDVCKSFELFGLGQLNGKWYRSLPAAQSRIIKNLPPEYKLPHAFVENLAGIQNESKNASDVLLYTTMFDTEEDFAKVVTMFVEKNYTVKDESHNRYDKDNYKDLLKIENVINQTDTHKSNIAEEDIKQSETEQKSKNMMLPYIGQKTCDDFEYINSNVYKNGLSAKILASMRKCNDIHKKFDWPVIDEFLQDNGVNIEDFINQSHDRAYEYASEISKNFFNAFQQVKQDKDRPNNYYDNESYLGFYVRNADHCHDSTEQLKKKMYNEYIRYPHNDEIADGSKIEEYESDDPKVINLILRHVYNNHIYERVDDSSDKYYSDQYVFLLRRFMGLLIKYSYDYSIQELLHNKSLNYGNKEEQVCNAIDDILSKSYRDSLEADRKNIGMYTSFTNSDIITNNRLFIVRAYDSRFDNYHGTSAKECKFIMNNYTRLYAFYYCCAKALKNAFDIKVTNAYSSQFNMSKEFNTDNEPDMQSVNFTAINKMMQAICKKIADDHRKETTKFKNSKLVR